MSLPAPVRREQPEARPGRSCPVSYRYSPTVFDRPPQVEAEVLYVIGGLYGNVEALDAIERLAAREPVLPTLVFNGDFHWFDVDAGDFAAVSRRVLAHHALRGNVETEIAHDEADAGCGCAYPADVSDADVARSNEIIERLRATARTDATLRERLGALPMHLVARVAEARVGIVHGDATSLAGWGFAHDRLRQPSHRRWIESAFRDARVDVFASTHTCLPALRRFPVDGRDGVVANNGAAGMPNFAATRFGLLTRIAAVPFDGDAAVLRESVAGVHVEALRVEYDHERWLARFLASWTEGSAAHASYFGRLLRGPAYALPGLESGCPTAA
ncbi:MAG TPA: hypothetical protein VFJ62_18980 [Usitatibacter sp.]|nr:hypothetical protein [Usitatibacter sp.]